MTPVIVDTSVTVSWMLADEPSHVRAIALRDQIVAGLIEPVVASHHSFEVRHALVRAARRSRCSWTAIPGYLGDLDEMDMGVASGEVSDVLTLALCQDLRLTWGDSLWVALAMRLGYPLVTADLRLVRAVPPEIAWVQSLGDMPQ